MDATERVLYMLVDFDNISPLGRTKGVDHILHGTVDATAGVLGNAMPRRVTVRLYGGWYDGVKMTRKAQELVRSKYFASPVPRCPTGFASSDRVFLKAELARTLLSRAGDRDVSPLPCTCRTRSVSAAGFRTRFPPHTRCNAQPCFVTDLGTFFRTGQCPQSHSHPDIADCVVRDEQKLVDVMLAADLLHLARGGSGVTVVLVSSDDDLWPAILQATPEIGTLVHIHTQEGGERERYEKFVDRGHYAKTKFM